MSNLGNPPGAEHGSDLAGATDLYPDLRMASGRQALAEAILRRFQTQRGALWYAPDYGTALTRFVNAATPESVVGGLLEREALKDERVKDARAEVTRSAQSLSVDMTITDDEGPFPLTLSSDGITVSLLAFGVTA